MKNFKSNVTPALFIALAAMGMTQTAMASGRSQIKDTPDPRPAVRVETPALPVSAISARNMLELRTAESLESFVGQWQLVMNVCDIETDTTTGGVFRESGVRLPRLDSGIYTIRIGKTPLSVLPDQAQAQFFASHKIEDNAMRTAITMGDVAPVKLHEKFVSFAVTSSLAFSYTFKSAAAAAPFMSAYNIERGEWAKPQKDYSATSRELVAVTSGAATLNWMQEWGRETVYCGISAHDRTLLICASKEKPEAVSSGWASPPSKETIMKGCATAYRRIGD